MNVEQTSFHDRSFTWHQQKTQSEAHLAEVITIAEHNSGENHSVPSNISKKLKVNAI